MTTKKTWLWIIGGLLALGVFALILVAGVGMYFVSQHIDTERATAADALRAFDDARKPFKEPLFEIERPERPDRVRLAKPLKDLPTSPSKPRNLWILAWDPDDERLVKVALPLWMLKFGGRKIDVRTGADGFDFDHLNLDVEELEASDEEPTFGLETLGDLTWKERMDFLSCVECKRCTDNCPANLAGQELDPRAFILDGRRSLFAEPAQS